MISVKCTGSFNKTENFLKGLANLNLKNVLDEYGRKGVAELKKATPKKSGYTASRWTYEVITGKSKSSIIFSNDSIKGSVPVVILLQYGHGTRNGGYVEGIDFINPALDKVFKGLADSVWREVVKL